VPRIFAVDYDHDGAAQILAIEHPASKLRTITVREKAE
jgi:hypothetical protein